MNESWGYKYFDDDWKKPEELLEWIIKINSRGGNYLLNVGPDAKGNIPEESVKALGEIGEWMKKNGEAIYETKAAPFSTYENKWGYLTYNPGKVYLHIFDRYKKQSVSLFGMTNKIQKAYFVSTREEVAFEKRYNPGSKLHEYIITFELPEKRPDDYVTVICLEIEGDLNFNHIDTLYK
jgi:alpha-L-fucosidase